ncbi:MAG: TIGR00153 family protein [Myxococcota bacterium]
MSFLDLFAKSPFKPMQEHMHVVLECARQVPPLVDALCAEDMEQVRTLERRIDELEGRADKLKNDLRSHLPRRLLLPVDRRDLLEILDLQDSIADTAQDIAELLVEREMKVPESMKPLLIQLARAVARACDKESTVIDELDELVEIGFRGKEADYVGRMIDDLGSLEEECDELEGAARRELFKLENTLSPVSVIFWYQIICWIGDLADHAEKAGNRIRLLIAR